MRCTHHWMCFSRLNRAKFVYWRDSWNHFDNELTLNRHLFVNIREHRVWCIYIHNRFRLQHCNEHIPAKHFFIPYCHCEITSETFHAILINYYEINLSIFKALHPLKHKWLFVSGMISSSVEWHYVRKVKYDICSEYTNSMVFHIFLAVCCANVKTINARFQHLMCEI